MANKSKVYVDVLVSFDRAGNMTPRVIKWETGEKYPVDRVYNVSPAPALRAGGQGDRYDIAVAGKEAYLFFERFPTYSGRKTGRWFVERK